MGKEKDKWDTSNSDHHIPYVDSEIDLILSFPPSGENCEVLGKCLKRSSEAIKMVFRVAVTPLIQIKQHYRRDDSFISQVKKITKKRKWITGHNITAYAPKKVAK